MSESDRTAPALLHALHFAADKHRDQRRKGPTASPYVNHPIAVVELLARVAEVSDPVTLMAAVLHDTVEDTETTYEELERAFGPEVRKVVEEVSDDKSLPKLERKQRQIQHAPHVSERAKLVKLADKISNIRDVAEHPPSGWSPQRRSEYLDWAEAVVAGLRGVNPALEREFDEALAHSRAHLGG